MNPLTIDLVITMYRLPKNYSGFIVRFCKFFKFPIRVQVGRVRLVLPFDDNGPKKLYSWSESWSRHLYELFLRENEGLFVDVGANLGQTLMDYLSLDPPGDYLGFEPNASCAGYIDQVIFQNQLNQCTCLCLCLGSERGYLSLLRKSIADSAASVVEDLRPSRKQYPTVIPCERFDDLVESMQIKKVGFIKIDVEGAEMDVLMGMKRTLSKDRPFVFCEVLFADSDYDLSKKRARDAALENLLDSLGYSIFQISKDAQLKKVQCLKRIQTFACDYFTKGNEDDIDYVFVPSERLSIVDAISARLSKISDT